LLVVTVRLAVVDAVVVGEKVPVRDVVPVVVPVLVWLAV